jgi:hypothetical protein
MPNWYTMVAQRWLFDHLVGAGEQRLRHIDAQCLRGLQIDHQLILGGCLYRQIAWLLATRRSFNRDFLLALAADFKKHGAAAIEKVRKQQPAVYMKICALLVPRELEVQHSGGVKSLSDDQIERGIAMIKAMLAEREAGANAKVIEGVVEPVPALAPPSRKAGRKVQRSDRADSGLAAQTPNLQEASTP